MHKIVEDMFVEVPKHKKKRKSSKSKSFEKSKHKHEYVDCLLIYKGEPHRASYCKICGKINDIMFCETKRVEKEGRLFHVALKDDEIFEKYKDLEHIEVTDIWNKYVPVSKEKKNDGE